MALFDLTSQFKSDRLDELILEAKEKKWTLKVEKVRAKRTLQQNSYYWALLTIYGIHVGSTSDEMHVDMRRAFGLTYKNEKTGKTYLKSTKTLDTKEMTDYIEFIKNHAGNNGYTLPDADYLKTHWKEYEQWKDEHKQFIGEQNND